MATKTSNRVTKNTAPAASTEAKSKSVFWANIYMEVKGSKLYLRYGLPLDSMFADVQEKLDNNVQIEFKDLLTKSLMEKFAEVGPGEKLTVDKLKVELLKVNTDREEFTDDDLRL